MKRLTWFTILISIIALLATSACGSDGDSDNDGGDNNSQTYVLTMAASEGGTTSPAVGTKTYDKGSEVDITATPDSEWQFDSWTGDVADSSSASTTVLMDGDKTVTANFTQTLAAQQWAAYAFDQTVSPAGGTSGTVKSFTIEETYVDDGTTRKFRIDSEYLGISEDTAINIQKMNMSNFEISTATVSMDCYQIKHHITVLQAPPEDDNPEWVEVTVWIPVDAFETTAMYFWIYPKATYVDSNGNTGEWGYYLTQSMQEEMDQVTATYLPYTEGDFYGYDQWTLFGLYGWAWTWFSPYAIGGDEYLEEGSWDMSYGGIGYAYSVSSETKAIDNYTFDAWSVKMDWNYGGESAEYSGIFSPDLPVPIYLKVGASGEGSQNYFQYELTNLVLE